MRKFILAAAIAASALTASAASAQDVSFRGFRVEGNIGWDKAQSEGNNNEKLGYGGQAGFDGQIGRIVVGPEFSYWHPNHDQNTVVTSVRGTTVAHSQRDQLGAAVRVGVLATPDLLVFGKGGYANVGQREAFYAPATRTVYGRGHADGYQVGGGVEYTLHDRFAAAPGGLYVSAQYVYANYDNHTSDQHAMAGVGFRFK